MMPGAAGSSCESQPTGLLMWAGEEEATVSGDAAPLLPSGGCLHPEFLTFANGCPWVSGDPIYLQVIIG